MKTSFVIAAAVAAFSFVNAAYAAPSSTDGSAGHYEWQQSPAYGPRAPLSAPKRVWVPADKQMAMAGGHYEWRPAPSFGPRSPVTASRRVWVADDSQVAGGASGAMSTVRADHVKHADGMAVSVNSASAG
ncbi:hypothetical protein AX777_20675 [Sphingobium yanoikuyae]|uniref:Uncharacterized protein n=1 Tax=Sphingobium yanoikuyae TaxID=13690 RepID=A0A177JV86_SPHYA|nr:hypothetical protein [Sphingobium yanoikuyae]OAH44686.1 hypothetical protein AX777_20675 [Sphingobium yanoikuyae]